VTPRRTSPRAAIVAARACLAACLLAPCLLAGLAAGARAEQYTDSEVRRLIVETSAAAYRAGGHACACPYDKAQDGSSCSGTSAYSGAAHGTLVCFRGDVTAAMVLAWRRAHP
jgi:hypothetical protein